jgi:hypothetical protein
MIIYILLLSYVFRDEIALAEERRLLESEKAVHQRVC